MDPSYLGRLRHVKIIDKFRNEAGDFTPWLAEKENLNLLGKIIDVELELVTTEKNVGPFRADIFCQEKNNDKPVVIENQYGYSDHRHLGQVLTYGANLDAKTIIWIAEKFETEHLKALDWLNANSNDKLKFFGLEIEFWSLNDKAAEPRYSVVYAPNSWKQAHTDHSPVFGKSLNAEQTLQMEYLISFHRYLEKTNTNLADRKRYPNSWMNTNLAQGWLEFSLNKQGLWLTAYLNLSDNQIGVGLIVNAREADQQKLLLESIRQKLDAHWESDPVAGYHLLYLQRPRTDLAKRYQWITFRIWQKEKLEELAHLLNEE